MPQTDADPNDHPVRANRGIVTIVITLGILIVLGLGGLVYGMAMKAGKLGDDTPPQQAAPMPAAVSDDTLKVQEMTVANGVLYLHLLLSDGREVVRGYDRAGRQLFEIEP